MLVRTDRRIRQLIIRDPFSTIYPNVTSEAGCLKKRVDLCPLKPYAADSMKYSYANGYQQQAYPVDRYGGDPENATNQPIPSSGRGSRVVQLSDRGWLYHEFELSTTKDPPCTASKEIICFAATLVTTAIVLLRCSAVKVAVKAGFLLKKVALRRHWDARVP
ncbi:hypothetical protein TNCV_3512581 [Trichonephila clavipes]|nr:hypothetical protein TNCV_3512581 [Trichonephila clavipes]